LLRKIDIAKNIIRKYEKFWSQNYRKIHNPEEILKKLDIKSHIEKRLEAERIVRWCMHIRNDYVRNIYKILIIIYRRLDKV